MVSPGGEGVLVLRASRFEKFDMNERTVDWGGRLVRWFYIFFGGGGELVRAGWAGLTSVFGHGDHVFDL